MNKEIQNQNMANTKQYDFTGWATKYGIKCSDGRTIQKGAFAGQDKQRVTLMYQHIHNNPDMAIGHADLEEREEGVYAYCSLNIENENAKNIKESIKHGDLTSLSIYANHLTEDDKKVVSHGIIRELSVVIAGANPGASIDNVMAHSAVDSQTGDVVITLFDDANDLCVIEHTDTDPTNSNGDQESITNTDPETKPEENEGLEHTGTDDKSKTPNKKETVKDILDSLNEEQKQVFEFLKHAATLSNEDLKTALEQSAVSNDDGKASTLNDVVKSLSEKQRICVYAKLGEIIENKANQKAIKHDDSENEGKENKIMANTLDNHDKQENVVTKPNYMSHSDIEAIAAKAKAGKVDSLRNLVTDACTAENKELALEHAGITDIEIFQPDPKMLQNQPKVHDIDAGKFTEAFWKDVTKSPFQKIRSAYFDISQEDARANGWLKSNDTAKIKQTLLAFKRETDGAMVYTRQSFAADDVIDLTQYDAIAFAKNVMQKKYKQEVARAAMFGDGRDDLAKTKIPEDKIRPVFTDDDAYTIKVDLSVKNYADEREFLLDLIDEIILAQDEYEGAGRLTAMILKKYVTKMLLLKGNDGRDLYASLESLKNKLGVDEIIKIDYKLVSHLTDTDANKAFVALLMDFSDYNVGSNPKGQGRMFDDFDINFNKYEYLFEGKMSGANVAPYSAIAITGKKDFH